MQAVKSCCEQIEKYCASSALRDTSEDRSKKGGQGTKEKAFCEKIPHG